MNKIPSTNQKYTQTLTMAATEGSAQQTTPFAQQPYVTPYNAMNMLENMLYAPLAKQVMDTGLSAKNVGYLILLSSLKDLKTFMHSLITQTKTYISDNYKDFFKYIGNLLSQIYNKLIFRRPHPHHPHPHHPHPITPSITEVIEKVDRTEIFEVDIDKNEAMKYLFFDYVIKNWTYEKKLKTLLIKNLHSKEIIYNFRNINMQIDDVNLSLLNNYDIVFLQLETGEPKIKGLTANIGNKSKYSDLPCIDNPKRMIELFDNPKLVEIYDEYIDKAWPVLGAPMKNIYSYKPETTQNFVQNRWGYGTYADICPILQSIYCMYEEKKLEEYYVANLTFLYILYANNPSMKCVEENGCYVFDYGFIGKLWLDKNRYQKAFKYSLVFGTWIKCSGSYHESMRGVFSGHPSVPIAPMDEIKIKLLKLQRGELETSAPKDKIEKIQIHLRTERDDISDLNEWCREYIEINIFSPTLHKGVTGADKDITIYNIRLIKKTTKQSCDNPEYLQYQERKQEYEKACEDKSVNTSELLKIYNLGIIPPKKLTIKDTKREIICEEVNKGSKKFSTLYLRKEDKEALTAILHNYSKSNELYKELGIRKKLGIMLYGEAGTGKSTSILAIATYLQRDIYYISLNGIQTNSELKQIFDMISKDKSRAGIVVFEDIDAQSPIVHKRTTTVSEKTVTELMEGKDDTLDLSYFLNLLDGTLSRDDTVFIMSTNHLEKLDPALYRSGRIDVTLNLQLCNSYQIETIFQAIMKRKIAPSILSSIREDRWTPADIIFHLVRYVYTPDLADEIIMKPFMAIYNSIKCDNKFSLLSNTICHNNHSCTTFP